MPRPVSSSKMPRVRDIRYPLRTLTLQRLTARRITPSKTRGGDDYYQAKLIGGTVPVIVDVDGTVYTFGPSDYNGPSTTAEYPISVEDRNGNVTTIGQDTLGRAAVSWSGFGQTGNTVTVSGLPNPYTLTWGTASYNFSSPNEPPFTQPEYCGFGSTASGTQSVITAIQLPNGGEYQFSYESTFGQISQITYPTGGYVQYTWGFNSMSALANWSLPAGDTGNGWCEAIYSKPAITDRYVSFDGSTIALHQHFAYTTSWTANAGTWTTKTTTVTTTDEVRQPNVTTTTSYTYGFVPGPYVPNLPEPPTDNQIPVEQTIVYQGNGATLLAINKTWQDQYELASEQDKTANGLISLVSYTYGPGRKSPGRANTISGPVLPGAWCAKR